MPRTKIQQRREARGLSRAELAAMVEVSENTIYRFDIFDPDAPNPNAREPKWGDFLTIAEALRCSPASLVADVEAPMIHDELEPISSPGPLTNAQIHQYRVLRSTLRDVPYVREGDVVFVNQSAEAIGSRKSDDVLLLSIGIADAGDKKSLMLLQFHAPAMVLTNRPGLNWALRLDDPAFDIEILGKVMVE